ncbi:hypothetical protein KCU83_g506, partial [Aureobasidium melanogenum]
LLISFRRGHRRCGHASFVAHERLMLSLRWLIMIWLISVSCCFATSIICCCLVYTKAEPSAKLQVKFVELEIFVRVYSCATFGQKFSSAHKTWSHTCSHLIHSLLPSSMSSASSSSSSPMLTTNSSNSSQVQLGIRVVCSTCDFLSSGTSFLKLRAYFQASSMLWFGAPAPANMSWYALVSFDIFEHAKFPSDVGKGIDETVGNAPFERLLAEYRRRCKVGLVSTRLVGLKHLDCEQGDAAEHYSLDDAGLTRSQTATADLSSTWTIETYSYPGAARRRLEFVRNISQCQQSMSLHERQPGATRRPMRCAKTYGQGTGE